VPILPGQGESKEAICLLDFGKTRERITIDPATYPDFHIKELVAKFGEGESV
jgi:hypothetical protein